MTKREQPGCLGRADRIFQNHSIRVLPRDVIRLVGFYERLGFRETYRPPKEGAPAHVEVTSDRFTIGISSVEVAISDHGLNPDLDGHPIGIPLWADVTDLDPARLISEGAASLSPPHTFHADQDELRSA